MIEASRKWARNDPARLIDSLFTSWQTTKINLRPHTGVVRAVIAGGQIAAHEAMFHHMSLVEQAFDRLTAKGAGMKT